MTDLIEQNDELILRYLRQQLGEHERAQFEIRMLEEPELLERVQLLEALQAGLRDDAAALIPTVADRKTAKVLSFADWLRQPLSLAASLLVAALGLNTLLDPGQATVPDALPVGALLLLDARRDMAVPSFTGAGPYLLQIDAGIGTGVDSLQLTLRDAASATLFRQEVNVDADGWVRLLYTPTLEGSYRIDLDWSDGTGASQTLSYPFTVQAR